MRMFCIVIVITAVIATAAQAEEGSTLPIGSEEEFFSYVEQNVQSIDWFVTHYNSEGQRRDVETANRENLEIDLPQELKEMTELDREVIKELLDDFEYDITDGYVKVRVVLYYSSPIVEYSSEEGYSFLQVETGKLPVSDNLEEQLGELTFSIDLEESDLQFHFWIGPVFPVILVRNEEGTLMEKYLTERAHTESVKSDPWVEKRSETGPQGIPVTGGRNTVFIPVTLLIDNPHGELGFQFSRSYTPSSDPNFFFWDLQGGVTEPITPEAELEIHYKVREYESNEGRRGPHFVVTVVTSLFEDNEDRQLVLESSADMENWEEVFTIHPDDAGQWLWVTGTEQYLMRMDDDQRYFRARVVPYNPPSRR